MADATNPIPLDKMTPNQQRDAALAAMSSATESTNPPATDAPRNLGQMTERQQRDAALNAMPQCGTSIGRGTVTAATATSVAPTPRYRFDAKRGTVLDNPEDFPPTAA